MKAARAEKTPSGSSVPQGEDENSAFSWGTPSFLSLLLLAKLGHESRSAVGLQPGSNCYFLPGNQAVSPGALMYSQRAELIVIVKPVFLKLYSHLNTVFTHQERSSSRSSPVVSCLVSLHVL